MATGLSASLVRGWCSSAWLYSKANSLVHSVSALVFEAAQVAWLQVRVQVWYVSCAGPRACMPKLTRWFAGPFSLLANGSLFRMQYVLYRMHLINTFLDFHLTCGLSFAYVTTEVSICHRLSSLSKQTNLPTLLFWHCLDPQFH